VLPLARHVHPDKKAIQMIIGQHLVIEYFNGSTYGSIAA
jgi:hypothetical protein